MISEDWHAPEFSRVGPTYWAGGRDERDEKKSSDRRLTGASASRRSLRKEMEK